MSRYYWEDVVFAPSVLLFLARFDKLQPNIKNLQFILKRQEERTTADVYINCTNCTFWSASTKCLDGPVYIWDDERVWGCAEVRAKGIFGSTNENHLLLYSFARINRDQTSWHSLSTMSTLLAAQPLPVVWPLLNINYHLYFRTHVLISARENSPAVTRNPR